MHALHRMFKKLKTSNHVKKIQLYITIKLKIYFHDLPPKD